MNESKPLSRVELGQQEIQTALKKAEGILSSKFPRINESDFASLYGAERVAEVIIETKKIESRFQNDGFEKEISRGTIFEALILDLFQNFWFDNLNMKRSSKTDDYINKVDTILTKRNNPSVSAVALSLDPTTSLQSIQRKANLIRSKHGLTNIDFCEIGNFRGRLEGVPHVALYINDEIYTQLVRLWINQGSKGSRPETLSMHPIQLIFLEQILHQLNLIIKSLKSKNILTQSEKNSLLFSLEYQRTVQLLLNLKKQQIEKHFISNEESLKEVLKSRTYLQPIETIKALFV
jgi:hypothetical protein